VAIPVAAAYIAEDVVAAAETGREVQLSIALEAIRWVRTVRKIVVLHDRHSIVARSQTQLEESVPGSSSGRIYRNSAGSAVIVLANQRARTAKKCQGRMRPPRSLSPAAPRAGRPT